MNMSDTMTYLLNRMHKSLPLSELSDVFDTLIWCTDDNGADIELVRNEWLHSEDSRKVEVALYMAESFPFDKRKELVNCFNSIKNKFPKLEPKCDDILKRWDEQFRE